MLEIWIYEIETMKGINHLITLIGTTIQYEKISGRWRGLLHDEATLTVCKSISTLQPLFSHVVHHWDTSLQSYQRLSATEPTFNRRHR